MDPTARSRLVLRESIAYWSEFISRCISERLETDRFRQFVLLIHAKHPLPPIFVADLSLKPQPSNCVSLDPRIPLYIQVLSQLGYVDAPSILQTLYRYSALHTLRPLPQHGEVSEGSGKKDLGHKRLWRSSSWFEEVMFYHVIKAVVDGSASRNTRAALVLVRIVCKWMHLFTSAFTAFTTDVLGQVQNSQVRDEMDVARAAFVPLLLRLVETPSLVKAISKPFAQVVRKELSQSLTDFMHTLQHAPGVVERLEVFRSETLGRLDSVDKNSQAAANAAMDELLDPAVGLDNLVIPDMLIPNTRAGLYVYLNAALAGRPVIDDTVLLSLLHNRYQGETQSSAIDLILASFDILANAVFRHEGPRDAHLLRSFLVNKVPLLLCQIFSPQFSTTSSEFCITEALNQVDTSVFPTASLMFDESRSNNPYTESVREEFCTACALHGLVLREHVERILGETSMSYEPSLEKYSKDKLVRGCLSSPETIQDLVRELDKMDGNVGAVCQALVELMRQLCNSKETMSLKMLCGRLAQKPQSLDILLLFEKLPAILEPLCQLLDSWRYDDDQGEYQPIYDEFGAILLLILSRGHLSRRLDELTKQENGHVSGWIHGLFDSETGGLGDDLMSSCPPQEFYLLVATIFQNIVVGYTHGYLNDESLKSGIEYVVDTFLLPSLIPAIRFLADYLWVEQKEQKSIIKILQLILLPSSISGEASTMLTSVKNVIAQPLDSALRTYQKQDPKNQGIEPLLRALKDNLPFSRRTGGADHNELELWSTSSSTGLAGSIRYTVQALVQWSMHHGLNVMPTPYTHRQMIASCRMAGTGTVLRMMLEEIRHQSEAGSASVAYDVVAALVCAPDVTNEPPAGPSLLDATGTMAPPPHRRLTLRAMLKTEAERCRKLQKQDAALAEIVVRLHRRVEAQMVLPQPQAMLQAQLDLNEATSGLGDAIAAAAAGVPGDGMSVDGVGLDMGMGGVSSDLGLGGPGNGGVLDTTSDADLFGGIDTSMDMFNGWDGMDLAGS
ncbi:Mediator of RNA polymerase II transcription subunit 5 [Ophiocordyceps sinensis CO18]|uniref:Mediator of RNA polymerase II transcription subunit 5 n=1 Tax=Ophiocordyceps sinensis (strain Co18 / CGMCC 3.14243) TaxID=911162 RepID=T5A6W9_OPHSC|nr:Mediator of RNA polymerase II transcription subunit 5 [Ophiocordyceps sinensis CO18]